jgi:NADH-ubiquinone oxidoreductase chain 5
MSIAIINSIGSFNIITSYRNIEHPQLIPAITILVVAACTKRAQIPFSAWLPAAIAAPTPVSALVHSSTLVTAGVYILIRFSNPIRALDLNKFLLVTSVLTILIAGVGANLETDLKKIIALSTLRQLGLIIIAISINIPKLAYFHMLTHALFKALLFMCAGNIIHCNQDTQDLRKIGTIISQMPVTSACLNTANLALCGAPFITGFYSKDLILEYLISEPFPIYIVVLAYAATALTVTYSLRLSYYALASQPNVPALFNISDNTSFSSPATNPLIIMSVVGGAIIAWLAFPTPPYAIIPFEIKTLILAILSAGLIVGLCVTVANLALTININKRSLNDYAGSIWFLPYFSTRFYQMNTISLGHSITYFVDRGWTEYTRLSLLHTKTVSSSSYIQLIQISPIKFHLTSFIVWFTIIVVSCVIYPSSLLE